MKKFFIYGKHAVCEFLKVFPQEANALYFKNQEDLKIFDKAGILINIPKHELSSSDLRREFALKEYESPQGIVLEIKKPIEKLLEISLENLIISCGEQEKNLLFLSNIQDQHNLGAVSRSCVAFDNITGIIMPAEKSPNLSAVVAKVSVGGIFHLKFARSFSHKKTMCLLKSAGFKILGIQNNLSANSLQDINFRDFKSCVIIMGGEEKGLPEQIKQQCDLLIKIPQSDKIDSLNLSVASSVILYEINKQQK